MKPLISFVTPMKEQDFRVIRLLKSIRRQNYPQDRIEIIITDGGSNPKVLEACKQYGVRIYHNPKGFAEGAGMGKDQGIWHSKGEFVIIAEADLEFKGEHWLSNMLKPFEENKDVFATVPKLYIHPNDSLTNRYLSYVGVDPFAAYRSLEGQLTLNGKLKKTQKNGYFLMELNKKQPFCMGSNGFMFRKSLTEDVGDYAQDIEFIARLANKGHVKFAVVENARVWHKNVKGFSDFFKKRIKWTKNYSKVYIKEKKDFNWFNDKPFFFTYVAKNLLIIPNIPISIEKARQYRDVSFLLHAPLLFLSTLLNLVFTFITPPMLKQVFSR